MKKLGLYFHIPFCNSKCLYCDFDSHVSAYEERRSYVDALIKEIKLAKEKYEIEKYTIDTIFIGGGTPTALDNDLLEKLLFEIDGNFSFSDNLEYSIEINPNSIEEEKVKILQKSRINRISIGLQSANAIELKSLGRSHSYEDFEKTYHLLKEYGFDNISVDLMMGIPNQTLDSYKNTMEKVLKLQPSHISSYMLIIEDGTAFAKMYEKGLIRVDDDFTLKLYDYTIEHLQSQGYQQYEISNFAKKGKKCRHNIRYWKVDEYLGLGQSAASYINKARFSNRDKDYVQSISNNIIPITDYCLQTKNDLYEEWIFLKLRMNEGIIIDEMDEKFSMNFKEKYSQVLESLKSRKLINDYRHSLSLTREGFKLSNSIFLELM